MTWRDFPEDYGRHKRELGNCRVLKHWVCKRSANLNAQYSVLVTRLGHANIIFIGHVHVLVEVCSSLKQSIEIIFMCEQREYCQKVK